MPRGKDSREKFQRFNLVTGTDQYASQTAQNPSTSRRLQSLIPSLAGDLRREAANPLYLGIIQGAPVGWLFEFDHANPDGTIGRYWFAATATQILLNVLGNWNIQTLPLPNGTTSTTPLNGYPQAVVTNNLMHLSDGINSWLYDGATWVLEGLPIPLKPPQVITTVLASSYTVNLTSVARAGGTVSGVFSAGFMGAYNGFKAVVVIAGVTDASFNGTYLCTFTDSTHFTYLQPGISDGSSSSGNGTPQGLTVTTNKYYWYSFLDNTTNRGLCQSDTSPASVATGALGGTTVDQISPRPLGIQLTNNSNVVSGLGISGGSFVASDVGQALYYNAIGLVGIIQSVSLTGFTSATLDRNWAGGTMTANGLVAPQRATHWVIYASESENSQIGFQLAIVPLTGGMLPYIDTSPFIGDNKNYFTPIERPVRNDPPVPSKIQTVHKNRIFRRRETKPSFVNFTAYEEVLGNLNGSPQESTPGTDPNTLSDIVNEDPFPDSSVSVRGIVSHGEALYLGSEQNVIPLYGQSIDDFTLSQIVAFRVGFAGRYAEVSTPHGLCFVSYDKKVYMYPSQFPAGGFSVYGGDSTQYLIELSRPLRPVFENIKSSDLDNVRLIFYNYGRRNWLVVAFQDKQSVYHTWVYDFETQGWFELQRGVASLAVFEAAQGDKFLVGGGTDGQVYVLDDLTGTYTSNANLPAATFRPALIDWGKPDHYHIFRYVEFEVDNVLLGTKSITINYYIDPVNVDSPGAPSGTLVMSQVRGSNFFRGFTVGGALCYRLLLEILVASDQNAGVIRGLNIVADEAASLIF